MKSLKFLVSIPHRFDSHAGDTEYLQNKYKFQSLTGSIHTILKTKKVRKMVIVSIPHRFDSHTGDTLYLENKYKFQSLTGSIHTFSSILPFAGVYCVSIPHRFDSHKSIRALGL